jgi:dCMP deaminase
MTRLSIDDALMSIAHVWELRSTCSRNHVGAVIARDGRHIGSGYNGAPAGMAHCEHNVMTFEPKLRTATFHVVEAAAKASGEGCTIAIHAEANALAYCARDGISVKGATIYTTLSPCYSCSQLIIAAGLVRVAYSRAYRDPAGIKLLRAAGLTVDQMTR